VFDSDIPELLPRLVLTLIKTSSRFMILIKLDGLEPVGLKLQGSEVV
jgi:hypothetical protein